MNHPTISNLPAKLYLRIENYGLTHEPEDFNEMSEDRMFWLTERGCADDIEFVRGDIVQEIELKSSASISKLWHGIQFPSASAPSGGISKEELDAAYRDWCKDTGRNGGVLIGKSIRDLFEYLSTLSNCIENIRQIHELDLHLVDEHGMDPNAPMLGDDFFPTLPDKTV